MNEEEKEYVQNVCAKCLNRLNDRDLCNIVKTINGTYKCSTEEVEDH
ncbi:MAG: hypothetical protein HUJ68_06350 [Clostridia bacterium]|nr:hypothetical protein [Clostridia bacterium]